MTNTFNVIWNNRVSKSPNPNKQKNKNYWLAQLRKPNIFKCMAAKKSLPKSLGFISKISIPQKKKRNSNQDRQQK